jgi:hypothetical protein
MSVSLTLGQGLTIGKGITFGSGSQSPGLYLNKYTFNPGETMTWTLVSVAANTTYYVWVDGGVYSGSNFTPAIVDGTTSVTTDCSGNDTFSLVLNSTQLGYTFNMWFAPTLYQGGVGGYASYNITVNAGGGLGPNWIFDTNYLNSNLVLTHSSSRVYAENVETGLAIGVIDGGLSLADVGSLVVFSVESIDEDSQDVADGIASFGIANHNADLNNPLGNDLNSWGWKQNGEIWFNGEMVNSGYPTWGPGDFLDIAINITTHKAWVRVNGGDWQGRAGTDPATGGRGLNINAGFPIYGAAGSGNDAYPAVNPGAINNTDAIQITNNAESGTYRSIPTGFIQLNNSWWC